ncbi:hypothetical protein ACLB2K_008542 [Fragaria x ananassa]
MPEPSNRDSPSSATQSTRRSPSSSWPLNILLFSIPVPVATAVLLYQLDPFDPAPFPHELMSEQVLAPLCSGWIFSGAGKRCLRRCADGWIKRVTLNESVADLVVENWVNTGGRPLELAHHYDGELLVADAKKGLLSIDEDGAVELLTDEAEGEKFKATNYVDVATDGMIYFTDASYKYNNEEFIWDFLEGRPYGRLLSYNPLTKETKVLVRDLYFANGVAVSSDQSFVIFCETFMRSCRKFHLQGEKKGSIENFIDNLPGARRIISDTIGDRITTASNLAIRYPFIRKGMAILEKYVVSSPQVEKNSGVVAMNLEGELTAHYTDPDLSGITSGIKIGNYLYYGWLSRE